MTLADFVVEDRTGPPSAGIAPGERVLHSLMAIVYGAMLCRLVPVLRRRRGPPDRSRGHRRAPAGWRVAATLSAVGIAVSGARDPLALRGWDPFRRWAPRVRVLARCTLPTAGDGG